MGKQQKTVVNELKSHWKLYSVATVSLLMNVAVAVILYVFNTTPYFDFALEEVAITRGCYTDYSRMMDQVATPARKAVYSENFCRRNYLTGQALPFESTNAKLNAQEGWPKK